MENHKRIWIEFIWRVVFAIIFIICFKSCIDSKNEKLPITNNYLSELNQHWNKKFIESESKSNYYKRLSDSLVSLKPALKTKIVTLFDKVYIKVSDSVKSDLDSIKFEYEYLEFLNVQALQSKDSALAQKDTAIFALKKSAHNDSIWIIALQDSIAKVYKRALRKGRKQGFVFGIGTGAAIWVGSKIKP